MHIKWIVCQVDENEKQAFSIAQEQWKKMVAAEGFIAQAGGWNLKNKTEACIIAFWESRAHLDHFMATLHDEIFQTNKQEITYRSIQVTHFESQLSMPGQASDLIEAVRSGKLLRVADCLVKPSNAVHFEKVQQEIWMPAMRDSKGMLGGKFSKADNFNYLVTTFWEEPDNHTFYAENTLPLCKEKAGVHDDTEKVTGYLVSLVESWEVMVE